MTRKEAIKIPELHIAPNGLIEDCFFSKMAEMGMLSDEQAAGANERLKKQKDNPNFAASVIVADLMVNNVEKFGVACIEWI